MGSFDFPKIIAAAAGSVLGVLSLVILAVSLLAYGFFRDSGDRMKLAVFAAMLVAAIGFGVSVIHQGQASGATKAGPTQANATATVAGAAPATPAEPAPPAAAAPAVEPAPPSQATTDISGTWRDDDGFTYVVSARGPQFTYETFENGAHAGYGGGKIVGRTLNYGFSDDRTHKLGVCTGLLSADGNRIDGNCNDGTARWGFSVVR